VAEHVADDLVMLEQVRQLTDSGWWWQRTRRPLAQMHRILRALAKATKFAEQRVSPNSAK
jgi:hypothetical protein